jgi:hypothetical protein
MARPDPIQYAERLYAAIGAANFSPISFLAFGNAIKDGVPMRNMPRIAAEPFMRVVGEMLDLEEEVAQTDTILVEEPVGGTLVSTDETGPSAAPAHAPHPATGNSQPPPSSRPRRAKS